LRVIVISKAKPRRPSPHLPRLFSDLVYSYAPTLLNPQRKKSRALENKEKKIKCSQEKAFRLRLRRDLRRQNKLC
jgi:hypothetical protein